ncbi:MAG: PIN domain-containing protein [Candidatus Bathyarchaeota archaeon]
MGAGAGEVVSLTPYERVYIDSMVFIYHFEGSPKYSPLTRRILHMVESGRIKGVTSTLTVMEILVKPLRVANTSAARDYVYLVTNFPGMVLRAVDVEVAEKASELRAKYNIRAPDAIHVATSIVEEADSFITNDVRLQRIDEVKVLLLNKLCE